jgi:hypothetical protein
LGLSGLLSGINTRAGFGVESEGRSSAQLRTQKSPGRGPGLEKLGPWDRWLNFVSLIVPGFCSVQSSAAQIAILRGDKHIGLNNAATQGRWY